MKVPNKDQMDKLSGNSSVFKKIEKGEMRIRIIGDVEAVKEHNIKVNGKPRFPVCPTETARMEIKAGIRQDLEVPPCPLCELGYPVQTSYLAMMIERESERDGKFYGGEAFVLKKGVTLLGEIQKLHDDADWGKSGNYDIKVTATGDMLKRKYSVVAVPADKSPELTKKELMSLEELQKKTSLEQMATPNTYKAIEDIIGPDFPDYESSKARENTDDIPF